LPRVSPAAQIMTSDRIATIRARVTTTPAVWDDGAGNLRTHSLARTAGQPAVLREAQAVAHYLRHRALVIHDGELLVGSSARTPAAPAVELTGEAAAPDCPYCPANLAPALQALFDRGVLAYAGNHTTIDYETILAEGFDGLIARIDRRLAAPAPDVAPQRDFLHALRIVAEAAIQFAQRYAGYALELAERTDDLGRRTELETIAANCRVVPAGPPGGLWQACQSLWMAFFLLPDSPGRIDQYLGPFYEPDVREGKITREFALELIECLWLKYFEMSGPTDPIGARHHVTLGGVKPDGSDAANQVTCLCLEATEQLRLFRPQVSFRWHRGTKPDLLARAVRTLRGRCGHPGFCSDEQIAPALADIGVALPEARNYSLSGCHEVIVSGMAQMGSVEGFLNLPKVLEIALGLDPAAGAGADLERVGCFEDLWAVLTEAMRAVIAGLHEVSCQADALRAGCPGGNVMASLVTRDCIERARGYTQGGARYNFCNWNAVGIANLADSLAAIRRLVFQEKALSLPDLAKVLSGDWAGREPLRRRVLHHLPHYGIDDDQVDALAADIVRLVSALLKEATPFRGGQYILGTLAGVENMHILFGRATGATPDGRKAGEPLADSLAAAQGRDRHGPTAMLNSVAKIPHRLLPTATTVNVKLDPLLLDSEAGLAKIAALVQGHLASGGQQLQFTLVNRRLLEQAQADPANHGDVIVRVAGYSAPFVMLAAELQAEILSRTEHGL